MFFLLLNLSSAMAEIKCDGGKTLMTRGLKPNKFYQEANFDTNDVELKKFMNVNNHIDGIIWDRDDHINGKSFTAIFDLKHSNSNSKELKDYIHISSESYSPNKEFKAKITIAREGKSECIEWEQYCTCCYYGDCGPTCLKSIEIPGFTYVEKEILCEDK